MHSISDRQQVEYLGLTVTVLMIVAYPESNSDLSLCSSDLKQITGCLMLVDNGLGVFRLPCKLNQLFTPNVPPTNHVPATADGRRRRASEIKGFT